MTTFSHPRESGAYTGTTARPAGQQLLEDPAVERALGRKVVQQAWAADADALGDVAERGAVVPLLQVAFDGLPEDCVPSGRRTRDGGFRRHNRPR